jgi:hypothetical protein
MPLLILFVSMMVSLKVKLAHIEYESQAVTSTYVLEFECTRFVPLDC